MVMQYPISNIECEFCTAWCLKFSSRFWFSEEGEFATQVDIADSKANRTPTNCTYTQQTYTVCITHSSTTTHRHTHSNTKIYRHTHSHIRTQYTNKVNRCLARYSPRHNHQPTQQQGTKWAGKAWQKCQFQAKFGRFWAKKSLFLLEKSKVLFPTYRKTHLGTLFTLFFGRAFDKMCKKWQYLAQNDQKCRFWTKFGRFWAKKPNFYGIM